MFIDYGRLRWARRAAHLSIQDVAHSLGVNKATIFRYEAGKSKLPAEMLLKMITLYEIDMNQIILGGQDNVKK